MGEMAGKEGIKILVENEVPCNVVTCAEFAAFMKLVPEKTVGMNWDPKNGVLAERDPIPGRVQAPAAQSVG
jgi:sugar phosphate isomerase/epimerase